MYAKKVVMSIIVLNIFFSAFCAEKKKLSIDRKGNETGVKLLFDEYKKYSSLSAHSRYIRYYPEVAINLFQEALLANRQDAANFYAQHAPLVFIMNNLATEGNAILIGETLPLMYKISDFKVEYDNNELPAYDCSGLQSAVCKTAKGLIKDERYVINIMKTIIKFYTPVDDIKCIKRCCWGKCTARCQERRKAFITHGLAKAGELAIQHDYKNIVNFIYKTKNTFPTKRAIKAANDKQNTVLAQDLKERRKAQLDHPRESFAQSYRLLRQFCCLERYGYGSQVAQPVIKDFRYDSWLGALGLFTEPPGCVRACPKE